MINTQAGVGLDAFDHDEETGRYHASYDDATVPPSLALASALASTMDADPTEIDPLYESVDPDAMDALVGDPNSHAEPVNLTFFVADFEATISSTGSIRLDPSPADGSDGGIAPEVGR